MRADIRMNDLEKTKEELITELNQLRAELDELKRQRAVSREDRLKLAIIDRAPFSLWACDRNFVIQLWSASCQKVYGFNTAQALGKRYLELFVSLPERERSRNDCIDIIDNDTPFPNFIAYDEANDKSRRVMLTNSFRIYDDDKKEFLQAEIGLEISGLEESRERHRTLREFGIAALEREQKVVDLLKRNLSMRLSNKYTTLESRLNEEQSKLQILRRNIASELGEKEAELHFQVDLRRIGESRISLHERYFALSSKILRAETETELQELEADVETFDQLSL